MSKPSLARFYTPLGMAVLLAASVGGATLSVYDQFDSVTASESLWTQINTNDWGDISFAGGEALVDMDTSANTGNTGDTVRIVAATSPARFDNVGDEFRITWDQALLGRGGDDGENNWGAGLFVDGITSFGVRGNANGGGANRFSFMANGNFVAFTKSEIENNDFHYDLVLTLASDDGQNEGTVDYELNVWERDTGLDDTPDQYLDNTPTATITDSATGVPLGQNLDLEYFTGPDGDAYGNQNRGAITVDNVFMIPEPTTFLLVLVTSAAALRRRI